MSSSSQQVAIVTGASSGIGKQLTLQLSQKGFKVIMACRNQNKAEMVALDIRSTNPNADLDILILNLASLSSVREFAHQVLTKYPKINILVNNGAETRLDKHRTTKDGHEIHYGTNYLAHFLLTQLLLERLRDSVPAQVINVTSKAYLIGTMNSDKKKNFTPFVAYGRSKLAINLGTQEMGRRLEGSGVKFFSVHPGAVDTEGYQNFWDAKVGNWFVDSVVLPLTRSDRMRRFILLTPEKSVYAILQLLESEKTKNGKYYEINVKRTQSKSIKTRKEAALWKSTLETLGLIETDFEPRAKSLKGY